MAEWAYFSFDTKLSHWASSLFLIKTYTKFPRAPWLLHIFILGSRFLLFFPMLHFPFSYFYPLLSTTRLASFLTQIGFLPILFSLWSTLLISFFACTFITCSITVIFFLHCQVFFFSCSLHGFFFFFHFYIFSVLMPDTIAAAGVVKLPQTHCVVPTKSLNED